jgi:hypothetical protein
MLKLAHEAWNIGFAGLALLLAVLARGCLTPYL